MKTVKTRHHELIREIQQLVVQSRDHIATNVNVELLNTYWKVGQLIVKKEHSEKYDEASLRAMCIDLSKELTRTLGKGFSRSQLTYMRLFYLRFKKFEPQTLKIPKNKKKIVTKKPSTVSSRTLTVSYRLSWSHYYELLKCEHELGISFYQQTAIKENWSVRELRRHMDTALFERIAVGKDAEGILKLASRGHVIEKETDILKDPYILEFLDLPEGHVYTEKQLEQRIIDNLQRFIMELGKGFTFVERQYRITLNNIHFYIDLVFYHRILKCFVLIDLKIKGVQHNDIGQMNLYLNYFEVEQNLEGDTPL